MKKALLILSPIVVILLILGWLNYNNASSQKNIYYDKFEDQIGPFPIINGLISPGGLASFLIDTGCDLSMITPRTIESLKANGVQVDSSFCPVVFRGTDGSLHFTTKRYTTSLPIIEWKANVGDDGTIYYRRGRKPVNMLHDVNFVAATDNVDVIGLDILKTISLEYDNDLGTVVFYHKNPEGYEPLASLQEFHSIKTILGAGSRFYMNMEIDGMANDYFLDTALDLTKVKHPSRDTLYARNPLTGMSILTSQGEMMRIKYATDEWMRIGNRSGRTNVSYYDSEDDDYAVNPLNFSSQDILIDFPNRTVSFRHHSNDNEITTPDFK